MSFLPFAVIHWEPEWSNWKGERTLRVRFLMGNQSSLGTRHPAIQASASGSLMLLGEHAVLHGRRALVCAIDLRMTVSLTPLDEPVLKIDSALGKYESSLGVLEDHSDFRFVLDAVRQYPLEKGLELKIESDFSSDIGFGSSAAVTVATHSAIMGISIGHIRSQSYNLMFSEKHQIIGWTPLEKRELFKRSLATIHRVQGRGSGADVAASVFGGVVVYRAEPQEIMPLKQAFPLTAVYSGSKIKTVDVIRLVEERRALNAEYFDRIFDRMDASVGDVVEDFSRLGNLLRVNQTLMEEMGLCNEALAEIIGEFEQQGVSAKISGSGLGDCAIGLAAPTDFASGHSRDPFGQYPVYALQVDCDGICLSL